MQSPQLHRVNVVVKHQANKFINVPPRGAVTAPIRPPISVPAVVQKKKVQLARMAASTVNKNLISAVESNFNKIRGVGKGRLLAIIGNGPSVNEASLEKLKEADLIDVMSINKPDPRVWPSRWWLFCDHSQYVRHQEHWGVTSVTVINSSAIRAKRGNQVVVKAKPGKGFSRNLADGFNISRSSCYAAMQVAAYMEYEKIWLFGVDMCAVNGMTHYFGVNPDVNPKSRIDRFKYEAEGYKWAADNLPLDVRQRFIFASTYNEWPFVQFFSRSDQKTAADDMLKMASEMRNATK